MYTDTHSEIEVLHQKKTIGLLKDYAPVARRKRVSAAIFLNDLAEKRQLFGRESQNQDWSLEALETNC
jgi:hypothetical protein